MSYLLLPFWLIAAAIIIAHQQKVAAEINEAVRSSSRSAGAVSLPRSSE